MPRNLVVYCDGTNNEFGPENTNVIRLVQVLVLPRAERRAAFRRRRI